MAAHFSQQQLEDYRQQRLAPAALIDLDDHLTVCTACRRRLEAALQATAVSLYTELPTAAAPLAEPHLAFEQLAGYVDDLLAVAERQFVADHLAACAQCAHAIHDLRAFGVEPVAQPSRAPVRPAAGWWDKLRARLWPSTPAPVFALVLASLLVILLAGWLLRLALRERPAPPQFARQGTTPTVAPSSAPLPTSSPEQPAVFIARLNDSGGQVTLDQQGKLTGLDDLPPAYRQLVKEALTTQRLAQPTSLAGLNRRGSSLMGADEQGNQFALTAPAGKVLLTDRPTFRWQPLSGATGYVVEIYDEQFALVTKSEALPRNAWTPAQPLARGRLYAWQVKANKDGQVFQAPKPPAPQARFRVLDQTQANELARARRAYGASHLTLGLLYARAGLLDEAEQELRTLQKANPQAAPVQRLLAQVKALRR